MQIEGYGRRQQNHLKLKEHLGTKSFMNFTCRFLKSYEKKKAFLIFKRFLFADGRKLEK